MNFVDCDVSQTVCSDTPPSFTELSGFIAALDLIIFQADGLIMIY